jgi:hypothetical protein
MTNATKILDTKTRTMSETTTQHTTTPTRALGCLLALALSATAIVVGAPKAHAESVGRNVAIDADVLFVKDAQEEGFLSNGDEPYIAVIGYRGTLGVRGSTSTWFQGGLRELRGAVSSSPDDDDFCLIPNSMGRTQFANVVRRSSTDLVKGRTPEIVGTVTIAFESDATKFTDISWRMWQAAFELRKQLDPIIGNVSLGGSMSGATLGQKLAGVIPAVKKAAKGSTYSRVATGLNSFGDPDDTIGYAVTGFVAVDDTAAATVDNWIKAQIPTSLGEFGALKKTGVWQTFKGDGATYNVLVGVTI